MKELRITLTDAEHFRLRMARKKTTYKSWKDFILSKCCRGVSQHRDL